MKHIPLSSGKTAVVDDEDFDRIAAHKWSYHTIGYAFRGVGPRNARTYEYMHRVILGNPDGVVDHINGDKLDNRRANLRPASKSLNGVNRRSPGKRNKSGCVGVSWSARHGKWAAAIQFNGIDRKLGYHASLDGAIAARRTAERELGIAPLGD